MCIFVCHIRGVLDSSLPKIAAGNTCFRRSMDFKMRGPVMHICVGQSSNLIIEKYLSLSRNDRSINYPYLVSLEGNKSDPRCKLRAEDKASSSCRVQTGESSAGHSG